MEGKHEEVLSYKCNTHDNRNPTNAKPTTKPTMTGKHGRLQYDTGGCAYLLNSETHKAIYVASMQSAFTPKPTSSTQEFTGLTYDPLPSAHIQELPGSDDEEYDALFMAVDELKMSIDWWCDEQTHAELEMAYFHIGVE
ncbi:hypothetical protein BDR07DRAFT_1485096 [Suillus spraguei]|nr:hypothetical protein BDR07DRAFT_1485096 [Suillus spraguei]